MRKETQSTTTTPYAASTQKTPRQSITCSSCEPMTGASTGASPFTSARRESMRTSGLPPKRSRTMAIATTPPAAAPKPCSRRKTASQVMSGANAAPSEAAMCSSVERMSGSRRPTLSLHGPTMSCPKPKPIIVPVRVSCTAAAPTPSSDCSTGNAGR